MSQSIKVEPRLLKYETASRICLSSLLSDMEENIFQKQHIHHCLMYEFRRGGSVAEAFKNICAVYTDAVKVHKCQLWFKRFKNDDCDISDKLLSERWPTLNENLLKETWIGSTSNQQRFAGKNSCVMFSYVRTSQANWQNVQRRNLGSSWIFIWESYTTYHHLQQSYNKE